MVNISLTEDRYNTLLAMFVEMVSGQPVTEDMDVRQILTDLLENTEAEDAMKNASAEEAQLIEAMSGMTIEKTLAEIANRKALVSDLLSVAV